MQLIKRVSNERGDTIVEVLVVMAVISSVLGAAYAVASRTIQNQQQAQEHSRATKVAESQLEQLRSFIQTQPDNAVDGLFALNTQPFCMTSDTSYRAFGGGKDVPSTDSDYPNECKLDDNGIERYMTGVKRSADTFTVYVNWDGPTGGRDAVSISYKVYK